MVTTDCDYCGEISNCRDDGVGGKGCSACLRLTRNEHGALVMPISPLTQEEKLVLYHQGWYVCEVPFVHHLWTDEDWIRHIDLTGFWYTSPPEPMRRNKP